MEEEPLNAEYDLLDPEIVEQLIELLETIDAPLCDAGGVEEGSRCVVRRTATG